MSDSTQAPPGHGAPAPTLTDPGAPRIVREPAPRGISVQEAMQQLGIDRRHRAATGQPFQRRDRAPMLNPNAELRGRDPSNADIEPPTRRMGDNHPPPGSELPAYVPGEGTDPPPQELPQGPHPSQPLAGQPQRQAPPQGQPQGQPQGGDPAYQVTIDGQPQAVPVSELVKGYMRNSDYTRKTQQLAAQAQEQAATFQAWRDGAQQFAQARGVLEQAIAAYTAPDDRDFANGVDWVAAQARLPEHEYRALEARHRNWLQAKQHQAQIQAQQERERRELEERMLVEGHAYLCKAIPGWADDGTRAKIQGDMLKWGREVHGFSEQDLAQKVLNPLQVHMAYKAMLHDRAEKLAARAFEPVRPVGQTAPRFGAGRGQVVSQEHAAPVPEGVEDRFFSAGRQGGSFEDALAIAAARRGIAPPPVNPNGPRVRAPLLQHRR